MAPAFSMRVPAPTPPLSGPASRRLERHTPARVRQNRALQSSTRDRDIDLFTVSARASRAISRQ